MVKRVPAARRGLDEQPAAELLDLGRDHVHADAAAGLLGEPVGGAEARLEDQLQRLLVGELLVRPQQAHLARLGADRRDVEAGAVVLDDDHDLGTLALQAHGDAARLRLAAREPLRRPSRCRARRRCAACARTAAACARAPAGRVRRPPSTTSSTCLPASCAAWRTRRVRRCACRWNGTMRVRIRPSCRSATTRPCCCSRFCASRLRLSSRPSMLADVAHRLGERARELLDGRIAVELERIEVGAALRRPPGA